MELRRGEGDSQQSTPIISEYVMRSVQLNGCESIELTEKPKRSDTRRFTAGLLTISVFNYAVDCDERRKVICGYSIKTLFMESL